MRIYAIDDEPKVLRLLATTIAEAAPDAEVLSFSRATDVTQALADPAKAPDAVFSDIELPGMNGLQLVDYIKPAAPQARIVFVTGYDHYAIEAYRRHVHGYLMKPVDADMVREELRQMQPAPAAPVQKRLYAQCLGPFEVFADGKPLPFDRRKTKELLAFLIDRRGATCTAEEIIAALWEDETDTVKAKHRLRNLVNDLRAALKPADAEDVLLRKSGLLAIKADEIDCDYYRMLSGDADAAKSFHGAYMSQYSWAEPTAGRLWFEQGGQA